MPSRSPSRRLTPPSPRSPAASNRSSFGMHSNSRRGRSPPTDGRRRMMLARGANARSGDGSSRGRGSEIRHPQRSVPPGGYPQGHYAGMQHSTPQHSPPRRGPPPASTKRHSSFSPSLPVVPSTSGLKRKYVPIPRSSSSSSSSPTPTRPSRREMLFKKKKLVAERMAPSRKLPISASIRKRSRTKSPTREEVHRSRSTSRYSREDGNFDSGPVSKAREYSSVGRSSGQTGPVSRSYTSSRRHGSPSERFIGEPVVRYSGEGDTIGDSRPIYRGPEKLEFGSYCDRDLKQIKIGIHQNLPVNEPNINRQIVKPEDIMVVRRPGVTRLESISPQPFPSIEKERRRGSSRAPHYTRLVSPPRIVCTSVSRRLSRDYDDEASTSRMVPAMSSQSRHKEGRGEDLRYELEYRRRDDTSYERGSRELRTDSDGASSDLRIRINEKRTSDRRALSHYHSGESTPVIHSKVDSDRVYPEHRRGGGPPEKRQRGLGERRGGHVVVPTQHEIMEPEDFQSRGSFHNKSSSSSIPSWDGDPEYVPKGRAYYEHDNRDEEWVRMGRGGGGPRGGGRGGRFPGQMGYRGRMFRGGYIMRGRSRGSRGYFTGMPGRGYTRGGGMRRAIGRGPPGVGGSNSYTRGKASSPSQWKHDMFENLSSDENRPKSTIT